TASVSCSPLPTALLSSLPDRPSLVLARPTFSRPCPTDLLSSLPTRPPDGSSTRVSKTARRGRHVGRTVVCNWTGPGWCSNTRSIPAVGWRYDGRVAGFSVRRRRGGRPWLGAAHPPDRAPPRRLDRASA